MHESVIGWFFHKKAINSKWKQIFKTHSHKWSRRERVVKIKLFNFRVMWFFPFTTFSWKSLSENFPFLFWLFIIRFKQSRKERRWSTFEWWEISRQASNRAHEMCHGRDHSLHSKLQLWLLKKLYTIKACNFLLLSGHHLKWFLAFLFMNARFGRRFSRNVYRNVFFSFSCSSEGSPSKLSLQDFFNVNFECEQRQSYLIIRLLDYTSAKGNRTTRNTNRESCTSI